MASARTSPSNALSSPSTALKQEAGGLKKDENPSSFFFHPFSLSYVLPVLPAH